MTVAVGLPNSCFTGSPGSLVDFALLLYMVYIVHLVNLVNPAFLVKLVDLGYVFLLACLVPKVLLI